MNDDIFRPGGGVPDGWSRVPGEASTINEAGTDGFAVDGTDAFAIDERPVEGPSAPPADAPDDVATIGRGRLAVAVGAALAGLLIVITVGSSTGPRPVVGEAGLLRSEDVDDTTTTTQEEDVEPSPAGAWSRQLMVVWDSSPDRRGSADDFDDEELAGTTESTFDEFDSTFDDESEFDDEFDFDDDFFDDDEFTGGGRTVLPRRPPVVTAPGRPRVTLPPNDEDEDDDEDTTTTSPTTAAPTTAAPTTAAPTTEAPTTAAPTTVAQTSALCASTTTTTPTTTASSTTAATTTTTTSTTTTTTTVGTTTTTAVATTTSSTLPPCS